MSKTYKHSPRFRRPPQQEVEYTHAAESQSQSQSGDTLVTLCGRRVRFASVDNNFCDCPDCLAIVSRWQEFLSSVDYVEATSA